MSERYPGGFISKNAPTVSTSGAQGVWTLEQQAAYAKAGQWPFGGPFNYIEDVFSTYLYTGNGSTLAINNGVDLSTYGGLVWVKRRDATIAHGLWDTARGVGTGTSNATNKALATNSGSSEGLGGLYPGEDIDYLSAFATNGFTVKSNALGGRAIADGNNATYASWTFRKQPKFFDVVTYTGTGATQTINHNLGSTPGCIIIKNYNPGNTDWTVYHRSLGTGAYLQLNNSNASVGSSAVSAVSSTTFTVAGGSANWNSSGQSYVAYLFAHDAGGFGSSNADNVISCGSFTTDGSGYATVTLGYEPQWVLVKKTSSTGAWAINDTMRGWVTGSALNTSDDATLFANVSNAETTQGRGNPTATGFGYSDSASSDYIYIAIRRGPMKTPTSGTSVFTPIARTGTGANATITSGFVTDTVITKSRAFSFVPAFYDRLRGALNYLQSSNTSAEAASTASLTGFDSNTGYTVGADGTNATINFDGGYVNYAFQRAPGFMDVVCYTYSSGSPAQSHNLGVVPELMIFKCRDSAQDWYVYHKDVGVTDYLVLNSTSGKATSGWITALTSSSFTASLSNLQKYVAYLFASCPSVSKVGSYTGTGTTLTIACGFAARWVMIKRTDSTGNWWFWDTSRGMVAGTDPRSAMNSSAAEINSNWVYTDASGFQIVTTDATVNASGGTYIYFAIA